jgi:hypothetical protein
MGRASSDCQLREDPLVQDPDREGWALVARRVGSAGCGEHLVGTCKLRGLFAAFEALRCPCPAGRLLRRRPPRLAATRYEGWTIGEDLRPRLNGCIRGTAGTARDGMGATDAAATSDRKALLAGDLGCGLPLRGKDGRRRRDLPALRDQCQLHIRLPRVCEPAVAEAASRAYSGGPRQYVLGPQYKVKPVAGFFAEAKALLGEAAVP